MSVVQLQNVSKVYAQGATLVHALRSMNLEVQSGEFTAISGPSGSGKTTALNLIGALDKPSEGTVRVDGQSLAGLSKTKLSHLRRDKIGFVFQAYNLVPVLTAYENAEIVMALQGVPEAKRKTRVMELLKAVGLQGLEHRRPSQMSGGQQQRVAIARAMAAEPAIILADEPTANVDSETAETLLDLMEKLNKEHGATFLFSTHDPRVMARAKRIVKMLDGHVIGDETKH